RRDGLIELRGRSACELADDIPRVRRIDVALPLGGIDGAAVDQIGKGRSHWTQLVRRGLSIEARSQSTSTIAEKSFEPWPCARAALYASRATVAMVTGTRSA